MDGRTGAVVVGEHHEVEAVLSVPAHDVLGRGVAVAGPGRMQVQLSLQIAYGRRRSLGGRLTTAKATAKDDMCNDEK